MPYAHLAPASPSELKVRRTLRIAQRSRGRGLRGAHTALIITLPIFRLNVDSIIGYTIPVSTKQESQYTEWKESWKDDYLKCLCAFANTIGGTLYVGINDKGKVIGLRDAKKLLENLPNKIRNKLGVIADVRLCESEDAEYVSIEVPAYHYLVSYEGKYYKRTGSTTQELSGRELEDVLLKRRNKSWDELSLPGVSIDELSEHAFEVFRKKCLDRQPDNRGILHDSREVILRNLQLIAPDGYLTHAAVLLFHPHPEKFFFGATIQVGYFRSESDLAYHDEFSGALIEQVDKLEDIIFTKYLKPHISYDGFQRLERYIVPRIALREGLLNAIVHRDYASYNNIQIKVFDDHIVIYNPGHLPDNWTIQDLTLPHYSCPYNPLIAGAFTKTGEVEKWGRGIETMLRACKEANMPKLKYEYKGSYALIFKAKDYGSSQVDKTPPPSSAEESILALIKHNPSITRAQLAAQIGVGIRTIDNHLRKLKVQGVISRVGSDKGGNWRITL